MPLNWKKGFHPGMLIEYSAWDNCCFHMISRGAYIFGFVVIDIQDVNKK